MNNYILRAKPHGYDREDEFLKGKISVGWPCGKNLEGLNRDKIATALASKYSELSEVSISMVDLFVHMQKGSIVLTPSVQDKSQIHIFETTSNYKYDPSGDNDEQGNPHYIEVEYLKTVARSILPKPVIKSLSGARKTLSRISKHNTIIEEFIESGFVTSNLNTELTNNSSIEVILEELIFLDQKYIKLFMEQYPIYLGYEKDNSYNYHELYGMSLEAQALLVMLGETALKRMKYIGFDYIYPFDNPIDWYDWKENIIKGKVEHTIFLSMSVRMTSEFKRMEKHLERDSWETYCTLSESEFLISKERYNKPLGIIETQPISNPKEISDKQKNTEISIHNHISSNGYDEKTENDAVKNLTTLDKKTSIWSNVSSIAKVILDLIDKSK